MLLVDVTTDHNDDQGEITTSTYACSDANCRKKNDEDIDKMIKKRMVQEEAHTNRLKKIQLSRKKK